MINETFNYNLSKKDILDSINSYMIIGAMDGISFDSFVDDIRFKKDKNIIFVEPVPYQFENLKLNTSDMSGNIIYENCGVSDKRETVKFAYFKKEKIQEKQKFISGCSCVVENDIPLNRHLHNTRKDNLEQITVECFTIKEILKRNKWESCGYIQIDTEGYDQRIVNSIDLSDENLKFLKFEIAYVEKNFLEDFIKKSISFGFFVDNRGPDLKIVRKTLYLKK